MNHVLPRQTITTTYYSNAGNKRRVLLVNAHQELRHTLSVLLKLEGHHVELAASGEEAIAIAETQPINVLVTDLDLPGMSGRTLMSMLSRRFGIRGIGFIDRGGDRDYEGEFFCLLGKPVQLAEIIAAIKLIPKNCC